jgi:hypothetical protein
VEPELQGQESPIHISETLTGLPNRILVLLDGSLVP